MINRSYPDVPFIVSGYFKPKDSTRCCVCGKELTENDQETYCNGTKCKQEFYAIQRSFTEEDCMALIISAREKGHPQLIK